MFTLLCSAPCGTLRWHYRARHARKPTTSTAGTSPAPLDEHLDLESNSEYSFITALSLHKNSSKTCFCSGVNLSRHPSFQWYFDCCSMAVYQIIGEGLGPRGFYQLIPAQPWLLWGENWSSWCFTCLKLAWAEESKGLCFLGVLSSAYSFLNELLKWHLISQFAHRGGAWSLLTPSPLHTALPVSNLVTEGTSIFGLDTSPFGLWDSSGKLHQSVTEFYCAAASEAPNRMLILQTFPWKCSRRKVFI